MIPPSAVGDWDPEPWFNIMNRSSTLKLVVSRTVVVPLTVKSPVTVKLFPIVTSDGKPIV